MTQRSWTRLAEKIVPNLSILRDTRSAMPVGVDRLTR